MIYQFKSTPLPTLTEVGGKGLSLMRLTHAGLPVPPGFICTTTFFEPWLTILQATPEWTTVKTAIQHDTVLSPSVAALKAICAELALTTNQELQLKDALKTLPKDSFYAVRSSSPEEDLEGASFAGGYKTSLGVNKDTLLDALRSSFTSAFDERVFVYKQQHGFAMDQPQIAVVVQQQIASDIAGVGFSLNPLNNDFDEAVINANWGIGESVVSGMVSPDHFVVDKVTNTIVEKQLGSKETALFLNTNGSIEEDPTPKSTEFCLTNVQLLEITVMLSKIETLFQQPTDIEWALDDGMLHILQARPITTYIPLSPEMMTKPGERRILYMDIGLTQGPTINRPMKPLTLDWFHWSLGMWMVPIIGPTKMHVDTDPAKSLMFSSGGRFYVNLSQIITIYSLKKYAKAKDFSQRDALLLNLLANIDEDRYRAMKKIDGLRWPSLLLGILRVLWHARQFLRKTISAFWSPEHFYRRYVQVIEKTVRDLRHYSYPTLSLRELIKKLDTELTPVIGEASFPALTSYLYYYERLDKLFGSGSEEDQKLVDSMKMGFAGNKAGDMGIQLYRMSKMLTPTDFADLDHLTQRLEKRDLQSDFLAAWDMFVAQYGLRGPGELELANTRYGEDPKMALEQMSYMVDSNFDPAETQIKRVAEREKAYEQLLQNFSGRKRRQLERVYKILDLFGPTRDTPKYLKVLDNGIVRHRALQEGQMFVESGRLDTPEDIFWLTLNEIDVANLDPSFDLRYARDAKQSLYCKLDHVIAFPHMIDSRGRIGQVDKPIGDPNVLIGVGISPGTAMGRVKVLHTPREKPVEKGDVLVAYTTDPGWTPLFVNAEAIILEVGGMLQHGGVVAREYGKPCVAGIQEITTTLQDGQLVEIDGNTGVVRILKRE